MGLPDTRFRTEQHYLRETRAAVFLLPVISAILYFQPSLSCTEQRETGHFFWTKCPLHRWSDNLMNTNLVLIPGPRALTGKAKR